MPGGLVIGVDLGGTTLLAGAVDEQLRVHHRITRPVRAPDLEGVLGLVGDAVGEIREAVGGSVAAVGFGIPSLFDRGRGTAVFTNHLPIDGVPFAAVMGERLGLPAQADNDGNCAMLAEHRAGAAAGATDAVLLTLGTGIAGGLVVGGRLVRGATGAAAEIGHMVVDLDGPPCPGGCPGRGCLEAVVSGTALARDGLAAARADPAGGLGRALAARGELTSAHVAALAADGDPAALDLVTRAGRLLGTGITSLVNLLNPEVVVVGGGVLGAGELLLGPARAEVAARALPPSRDVVRVVPTAFGVDSGMLGAALLARDALAAA